MDKLLFTTAGIPLRTTPASYLNAFDVLNSMSLDGMEIEFVHGVRISQNSQNDVINFAKNKGLTLTAHGPYYINLNSKEEEKRIASVQRVVETVKMAQHLGLYSVVFHAAFYMGMDKETTFQKVKEGFSAIINELTDKENNVFIRPETTGKATQWGDLDEVIRISKEFEMVLPCIDFSHLYARTVGGYNTYDEFCGILEKTGNELGEFALNHFHAHIAGIEYSQKGEVRHLTLENSGFNYKDLLKALKKFDVKGVVVCESPNIEEDAKLLKDFYSGL